MKEGSYGVLLKARHAGYKASDEQEAGDDVEVDDDDGDEKEQTWGALKQVRLFLGANIYARRRFLRKLIDAGSLAAPGRFLWRTSFARDDKQSGVRYSSKLEMKKMRKGMR